MLLFESHNQIHKLCQKYGIKNYTINSDGIIDVDGDVDLSWKVLKKIPLKFREVTGGFYCHGGDLTTLEGSPQLVGGSFYCYENKLTSLKDGPHTVGDDFACSYNNLTTLVGAPQSVGGDFYCRNNILITLKGAPQSVGGEFGCSNNKLTTLEGAPQSVGGRFDCFNNPLDSVRRLFPDDKTFYKLYKEWEFFAGDNKIHKHRFMEAMLDIGKKRVPRLIPGYEYI